MEGLPARPIDETDRAEVVVRIQQALAADDIAFDELDDRFALVYSATTKAELDRAAEGLPEVAVQPPPPDARHLIPSKSFSLLGDAKVGGWLAAGPTISVTTLVGDAVVDLSSATIPANGVDVKAMTLFGDIKIIVPDGARVQSDVMNLIGDRKEQLSPPVAGGPTIRITARLALGDVKIYSLSQVPEGALRRLWKVLRSGG